MPCHRFCDKRYTFTSNCPDAPRLLFNGKLTKLTGVFVKNIYLPLHCSRTRRASTGVSKAKVRSENDALLRRVLSRLCYRNTRKCISKTLSCPSFMHFLHVFDSAVLFCPPDPEVEVMDPQMPIPGFVCTATSLLSSKFETIRTHPVRVRYVRKVGGAIWHKQSEFARSCNGKRRVRLTVTGA